MQAYTSWARSLATCCRARRERPCMGHMHGRHAWATRAPSGLEWPQLVDKFRQYLHIHIDACRQVGANKALILFAQLQPLGGFE
eukprot:361612-Chlamydomonas_euryale.AAC.31